MANKPLTVSLGQFCLLVSDQKDPLQHSAQEPAHLQVNICVPVPGTSKFSARRTALVLNLVLVVIHTSTSKFSKWVYPPVLHVHVPVVPARRHSA